MQDSLWKECSDPFDAIGINRKESPLMGEILKRKLFLRNLGLTPWATDEGRKADDCVSIYEGSVSGH